MNESATFNIPALKKAIIENTGPGKKFSRRSLSLAASNGKNPDLIRDFLGRGQDKKPSYEAVRGIVNALGLPLSNFVNGPVSEGVVKHSIMVIGAVEAGAWRQQEKWDHDRQYEVDVYPTAYSTTGRFGLEVVGFSMDKLFLPGTILDCLNLYDTNGLTLQSGDIVIVERRMGDLVETTCKRLEAMPDGTFQLCAESTRPEFSTPIPLGKPDDGHFGDDEIKVIAVVNSAITRVLRR